MSFYCSFKRLDINCMIILIYFQTSFLPYIFELFLCDEIVPDESSALLLNDRVEFSLKKSTQSYWESLSLNLDKDVAYRLRIQALKDYEEKQKKLDEIKKGK